MENLERLHKKLVNANSERDYTAVIRLNWEFHSALYRRAEMPLLLKMIEACWLQAGSYLNTIYPAYGEISVGIHNHEAILDAAIRRKPDELSAAVVLDIELAAQALLARLADVPERRFEGITVTRDKHAGRKRPVSRSRRPSL
jgi:DNA-binding GntR family transcriptional regulator